MSPPPPPKDHQRGGVEWISKVQRGILADEPGLGKTRVAIDATKDMERVLVVAPSLVLSSGVWEDEIDKWGQDGDCEYTLAPYQMLNARKWTGAYRTNKDGERVENLSATKPIKVLRDEYKGRWDAVVLDECHYVKGRSTTWSWAAEQISKESEMFLGMTGTPIPNWAHEVFMLLRMMYPAEAKRGTGQYGGFWRWAEQWFDTSPTRFSGGSPVVGELLGCKPGCYQRDGDDPCEHFIRFTRDNFGDHWRRSLRKDCLDLPPFTEQTVNVPLDATARRLYRQLVKDFSATFPDGEEVLAWTQGAKNVMLDQMTVSPWMVNPKGEPHGGKLDMLRFDLESRSRPTFVVAHYRRVVEACARVAESIGARVGFIHGGNKTNAGQTVRDFKAGKLDVLVGSIETVAEGLTLTRADMCIFVEKSFKNYRNEQAVYRIHRMGQENPVTIRDYVCPNSVDLNKRKRVAVKADRAERTMTAADFTALL
jgi:hypothetical protein